MKKRNILNKMQKLDSLSLPEKEKILAVCNEAVPEAVPTEAKVRPRLRGFSPRKAVVVAMVAVLLLGGGITVAAAEAKEYGEAMDFFEEYNLSAEGFTRSEIKKIYRDIVSESFTYEKTEAALASGLLGYEIQAKPLDSDGLKRLWLMGYVWGADDQQQTGEEGVQYGYNIAITTEKLQFSEVLKMKNDQHVWRKRLENFYVQEVRPVGDQVLVAGELYRNGEGTRTTRVYLLDSNSNVIWCKDYKSNLSMPNVNYILYEKGNCVLFSASNNRMWILTIDMDGNFVSDRYAEYDSRGESIKKVVPVGDTYLMLKGDRLLQEKDGKVQSTVSLGNGDESYEITDIIEFNGLVYLSGRIVPSVRYESESGKWKNGLYEIYQQQFGETTPSAEEQLQFMKENHTAVLLICDPNSGEPQQFYTIPGASGGSLKVNGNKLDWQVNRYVGAQIEANSTYYLATGCMGLIQADVWQYVFNPYGQVVGEKDTGRSTEFEG